MKNVEFWWWTITDQWGRRRKSPCAASADMALLYWGVSATRREGTCSVIEVAETFDERAARAPTTQHLIGQEGVRR